jgi:hypothetical protein
LRIAWPQTRGLSESDLRGINSNVVGFTHSLLRTPAQQIPLNQVFYSSILCRFVVVMRRKECTCALAFCESEHHCEVFRRQCTRWIAHVKLRKQSSLLYSGTRMHTVVHRTMYSLQVVACLNPSFVRDVGLNSESRLTCWQATTPSTFDTTSRGPTFFLPVDGSKTACRVVMNKSFKLNQTALQRRWWRTWVPQPQ